MNKKFLATLLVAMAMTSAAYAQSQASAPANVNGTYTASTGQWTINLTVKGGRGDLTMTCGSNVMFGKATIGPDGAVSGSVRSGAQLTGNLNREFTVSAGGSCGNGTTAVIKKS